MKEGGSNPQSLLVVSTEPTWLDPEEAEKSAAVVGQTPTVKSGSGACSVVTHGRISEHGCRKKNMTWGQGVAGADPPRDSLLC